MSKKILSGKAVITLLAVLTIMAAVSGRASAQDMVKAVSNEGLEKVISYNVSSFMDVRDKKLEDVMAKMPGMTISPMFTYNGMTVVKVFINGIDMMNGDYSSAFSMKPEDVERIEITENYIYEKVMRGIEYSNSVAINIILKESAKNRWSGSVKAGIGVASKGELSTSPFLYSGEGQALNIGRKAQTAVLFKTDNTGLDFSSSTFEYYIPRVNTFLMVSPALAPLSAQRTRLNNSTYGSITTAIQLKDNLQMTIQMTGNGDLLKASSYDETDYFGADGEDIKKITGRYATKNQKFADLDIILLSNSEKSYFNNETYVSISQDKGFNDITGSYPSKQDINNKPLSLENTLAYKKPLGKSLLSIDFFTAYDSAPQYLSVERMPFNLQQDIATDAFTEELSAQYKIKAGRFSFAMKAGVNSKFWNLRTELTPDVPEVREAAEVGSVDNDSRFSYLNLRSDISATYITDKLQLQIATPLSYYRNFFNDFKTDDRRHADRCHFAPSLSGKYQITDNLSVSGSVSGLNDGLLGGRIYTGLVMTDFQSFTQGNVNSQNDKSAVTTAAITYRYPKRSFFVNGSFNRTNMNQELAYFSKFTENFNISGYIPVPRSEIFKSITDRITLDMSKGITPFKGKAGLTGSFSNTRSSMDRNSVRLPYSSKSYTLGSNINGRLFSWMNMIYSVSYTHTNLSIKDNGQALMASKSNGLTQSLELIFSPGNRFNFSFLGDHYMNQIAEETYKNFVIVDFKAEYKLNERWQLLGTVTNILNVTSYDYQLENAATLSKSITSYAIRPRNLLVSVFYKF